MHRVVSVFTDRSSTEAALRELNDCGYTADDIEAFCGTTGVERFDFDGVSHGVWTTLFRAFQHIGPDREYLERYESHLRDGHCMIMVSVSTKLRKDRAARIIRKHTDEPITYFGWLSLNEIH